MKHTLDALRSWLALESELRIVICDGSGFDLAPIIEKLFPSAVIECIKFENNGKLVSRFGKGYGEGEIIRHAMSKSQLLQDAAYFMKCTSKMYVKNLRSLVAKLDAEFKCDAAVRIKIWPHPKVELILIDTRFYIVSRQMYNEVFENVHSSVRDIEGRWLEHCFTDAVREKRLSKFMFAEKPDICGISGSLGVTYHSTFKSQMKQGIRRRLIKIISPELM